MKYIGDVTINEWQEECGKHQDKKCDCNCPFDGFCHMLENCGYRIRDINLPQINPGDTRATTNNKN